MGISTFTSKEFGPFFVSVSGWLAMKRPLDHWGHWIEGFLDAESIFVWYKIPKSILWYSHVTIVFYSICHYPFICHYLFWHENYWPGTLTPKCSTRARVKDGFVFLPFEVSDHAKLVVLALMADGHRSWLRMREWKDLERINMKIVHLIGGFNMFQWLSIFSIFQP